MRALPLSTILAVSLACGGGHGPLVDAVPVWDLAVPDAEVSALAVDGEAGLLAAAFAVGDESEIRFLGLSTGDDLRASVTVPGHVHGLALGGGWLAVSGAAQEALLLSTRGDLDGQAVPCDTCLGALSADGRTWALYHGGYHRRLEVRRDGEVCDLGAHLADGLVAWRMPLVLSPDGATLWVGQPATSRVLRFDVAACAPDGVLDLGPHFFPRVGAISPDGRHLVFAGLASDWVLVDAASGAVLRRSDYPIGVDVEEPRVAFGPTDRLWATTDYNRVAAWDLDGSLRGLLAWGGADDDPRRLEGPALGPFVDDVVSLAVTADGAYVAVGRLGPGSRLRVRRLVALDAP